MHQEVLNNLEGIYGTLLKMNHSIQAEGEFGEMKYDRWDRLRSNLKYFSSKARELRAPRPAVPFFLIKKGRKNHSIAN